MVIFIIFLLIVISLTYFHVSVLYNYIRYRQAAQELESRMQQSGVTEQDLLTAFNSLFGKTEENTMEPKKEEKEKQKTNVNNIMYQ